MEVLAASICDRRIPHLSKEGLYSFFQDLLNDRPDGEAPFCTRYCSEGLQCFPGLRETCVCRPGVVIRRKACQCDDDVRLVGSLLNG